MSLEPDRFLAAPFSLYFIDTATVLVKRALRGDSLFQAHREHVYQRLTTVSGLSHTTVSLAVAAMSGVINALLDGRRGVDSPRHDRHGLQRLPFGAETPQAEGDPGRAGGWRDRVSARIAMFSHWYDPEGGAAAGPGTIARSLRDRGHDVHVVTGSPKLSDRKVFPGYRVRPPATAARPGMALRALRRVPYVVQIQHM